MNEFESQLNKVSTWSEMLADAEQPCGPDLEYDNEFLALTQAAAGKPESQFGAAEPPDWRAVMDRAEALLDRSRDLRIAIYWLRAGLHTQGYGFLFVGLQLLKGLIEQQWEHLHPLPDADDGDPYARVNALTLLRENEGLIGDLRACAVVEDRAIGLLSGRAFELMLGLSPALSDETVHTRDQLTQMLQAALQRRPQLREQCEQAQSLLKQLVSLINERLGSDAAPDLRPLQSLVQGILAALPAAAVDAASVGGEDGDAGAESGAGESAAGASGQGGARRGLSGSISSREEAIRAIDMVCEYLERTEPTNPAPLFLRRGRQLIDQNFLQLVKLLAPDALAGVAGLVGIDPYSLDNPDGA